jgi:hypothetical protein
MHLSWLTLAWIPCALSLLFGCGSASFESSKAAGAAAPSPTSEAYAEEEAAGAMDGDAVLDMEADASDPTQRAGRSNALGAPPPPPSPTASAGDEGAPSDSQAPTLRAPLLIYQATLTMGVFETKKRIDEVEEIAKKKGGYLLTRSDQSITIRVPAATFSATLDEVTKTGDELHREVSARDVSDQYNDLTIRLGNAEAMRQRLVELLTKAQTVKEALAVEGELERIALQIEQIKGKLKRLDELIAFSTITVLFEARPIDKVESKVNLPFPWLQDLGLVRLLAM